jgi:hypothetical protein
VSWAACQSRRCAQYGKAKSDKRRCRVHRDAASAYRDRLLKSVIAGSTDSGREIPDMDPLPGRRGSEATRDACRDNNRTSPGPSCVRPTSQRELTANET